MDEAWGAYSDFKRLYGFPDGHLLSRLITEMSYSPEPKWLQRACDVALLLSRKKSNVLRFDLLCKLSLCLARAQMPVPASMILRTMTDNDSFPPSNLLGPIVLHMVKKEIGAYLASNILIEICDRFHLSGSQRSIRSDITRPDRPDTVIFNLVLEACLSHRLSFKAHQIIELMAKTEAIADAHTVVIIARIHEIDGQRDELKKFKSCVDRAAGSLAHHYSQFYDSLMSLHFEFNDIDAASELISDMIGSRSSLKGPQKPFLVPIGSPSLRESLKLQVLPHQLPKDSLVKLESYENGLVMCKNGKIVLRNKALAKLIVRYRRDGRINEFSKLLCRIEMERGSVEAESSSSDVIDACIRMRWLETAHDILDDTERDGGSPSGDSYTSLLTAYHDGNRHREAEALRKQIKKAGFVASDETGTPKTSPDIVGTRKPGLTACLVKETRETVDRRLTHEFNSSIYFFTKAKMMDDARKTYRRMQSMGIRLTVATYTYMIMGYSSLEMYREVTFIWGDVKRSVGDGCLSVGRDLYEVSLRSFLKGGYFEGAMEVVGAMKKNGVWPDKWLYRNEFLRLHKDLYVKLKSSDARTEAQSKRLANVRAFRKWAGVD